MKDEYVTAEEYDSKSYIIKCARNIGIAGGGICALMGTSNEDIGLLGAGLALAGISYFTGEYFHRRNEARKEKALQNIETKNLEIKLLQERRR